MPVTEYYLIGSITVPSNWVALIVGFLVAYIAIRKRYGKQLAERFSDAVFYIIIIWKLSVVITDFSTVIKAPMAIVYFNGGMIGFCLGLVFVALRLLLDVRKERLDISSVIGLFMGAVIVQAVYQVMMALLNDGGLVPKIVTAIGFLSLVVYLWIVAKKTEENSILLPILFMAVHFFVATLQPRGLTDSSFFVSMSIGLFFIALFWRMNANVMKRRESFE